MRFLLKLCALLCLTTDAALAWMDCNWPYRSEAVITETAGVAVTDYQVLLTLSASSFNPAYNWTTNGDDLRVVDSDDLTPLGFFIKSWDSSAKTAEVWVKLPALAANQTKTIYLYHGNTNAASASSAPDTFVIPGFKFHTRNSIANPANKTAGFAAFDAANDNTPGYGCTAVTHFNGVNNQSKFSPPSVNSNIAFYSEAYFEVGADESGNWSFRLGGDYGRGGGVYVDGQLIAEDWNNDLWWSNNWDSSDVLAGSINLSAGYHHIETIGFEGCCDGAGTFQYRKPNTTHYQTFNTNNISILSHHCPVIEYTQSYQNPADYKPIINMTKASEVINDPVNGTMNPKRIPGARVRYTLHVTNTGGAADLDSIVLTDRVPDNTRLQLEAGAFTLTDGSPASTLLLNYNSATSTTDDIAFSLDSPVDFTYTPQLDGNNNDAAAKHFQLKPRGRFACDNNGQATSFSVNYDVTIN